jgi:TPR repeat protein
MAGRGIAIDQPAAVALYEKAAALGHAGAQYQLALAYKVGDGVPKDAKLAAELLVKAAAQRHNDAKCARPFAAVLWPPVLSRCGKAAAHACARPRRPRLWKAASVGPRWRSVLAFRFELAFLQRDGIGIAKDAGAAMLLLAELAQVLD